jgi:hypothetical protein
LSGHRVGGPISMLLECNSNDNLSSCTMAEQIMDIRVNFAH